MPTPSEPEAARAARAAEKHAREGPGKAGPLPPCFCRRHITPPHCLSKVKTLNPRVLLWPAASTFCLLFSFGLLGLGFVLVWLCGLPCGSFSILAFWAVISSKFGLRGLDFLMFSPFWPSLCYVASSRLRFRTLGFHLSTCHLQAILGHAHSAHRGFCSDVCLWRRWAIILSLRQDRQKAGAAPAEGLRHTHTGHRAFCSRLLDLDMATSAPAKR